VVCEGGFPVHLLTLIEISVSMCMQFMNGGALLHFEFGVKTSLNDIYL
jgi:hypothetical protein